MKSLPTVSTAKALVSNTLLHTSQSDFCPKHLVVTGPLLSLVTIFTTAKSRSLFPLLFDPSAVLTPSNALFSQCCTFSPLLSHLSFFTPFLDSTKMFISPLPCFRTDYLPSNVFKNLLFVLLTWSGLFHI